MSGIKNEVTVVPVHGRQPVDYDCIVAGQRVASTVVVERNGALGIVPTDSYVFHVRDLRFLDGMRGDDIEHYVVEYVSSSQPPCDPQTWFGRVLTHRGFANGVASNWILRKTYRSFRDELIPKLQAAGDFFREEMANLFPSKTWKNHGLFGGEAALFRQREYYLGLFLRAVISKCDRSVSRDWTLPLKSGDHHDTHWKACEDVYSFLYRRAPLNL